MRISDWSSDVCSSDLSDDHEGSEAEATTTLDHLGDTVDRNDALDVRGLVGLLAATTVASTAVSAALALTTGALSALGSAHENYLFSFLLVFAIRTSGRPRGRHRQGPRYGRGTCCRRGRRPRPQRQLPWRARPQTGKASGGE